MAKGTVIRSTGSWYAVRLENGALAECRMRGKLRLGGGRTTNPVAVGDGVEVEEGREGCVITGIAPRRNCIVRKSTNLSRESHVIASNVDRALLVVTVSHPATSTVFIDRFLAAAGAYAVPAALAFNKADLCAGDDRKRLETLMAVYRAVGYPCIATSAVTGEGLPELRALLKDRITVLSGLSGVGKSSLINGIEPGLRLKTADLSDAHDAGRHTTTFAEMFPLCEGGAVIDTPGVRSFGLVGMKREEISHFFPEIFSRAGGCRFYNCTHTHEPGCAVRGAVAAGEIAESRYAGYLNLLEEDGKYRPPES